MKIFHPCQEPLCIDNQHLLRNLALVCSPSVGFLVIYSNNIQLKDNIIHQKIFMKYNIIDVPIHYPGKIPNLQADWRFLVLENCTCSSCHGSRNLPFYLYHQFSIGFWTLYKVLVWKLIPFFCVYHWHNLRRLEYFELWQVIRIKKDSK